MNICEDSFTIDSSLKPFHLFTKHFYLQKNNIKKHIFIVHGAVEYHKRYNEFISYLLGGSSEPIAISCYDHIGHGHSGGAKCYVESFSNYEDDLISFISESIKKLKTDDCEKIIVAHSLGGLIVLKTFLTRLEVKSIVIDRFIFSSPCIKPINYIPRYFVKKVDKIKNQIGFIRLKNLVTGKDLTHCNDKAMEFDNDIHIHKFITLRMGLEILKASEEIMPLSYFWNKPSLFLIAGDDKLVDPKATELFCKGATNKYVTTKIYTHAKHELLNETCRNEVFSCIMGYIEN